MSRKRIRAYGIRVGRHATGEGNTITDVSGVAVGQVTLIRDPAPGTVEPVVRTGVTTVWPHVGPVWREPVFAGTFVLSGYGELIGINQVNEWGLLQSPIVLTSSFAIGLAYDATAKWLARTDGGRLAMPVVTECDDSFLSDARSFPLSSDHVEKALVDVSTGEVVEGVVGAGAGMACFDFKGGIGTASRRLAEAYGGFTIGALVLTNFGRRPNLRIDGVRIGENIGDLMPELHAEGSCVVVVATDAPMLPHQLSRLAKRSALGLAKMGSIAANGSGELMIAFSTAHRVISSHGLTRTVTALTDGGYGDSAFDLIFEAAIEAVEESVLNALFMAETTAGRDGRILHALPVERTLELLEEAGRTISE